ncbi:MAG: hypothetical protein ACE5HE_06955 [Phycisphaerae bacterium]
MLGFENSCEAILKCLRDVGGRLPPNVNRDSLAALILTVMEGGVMLARAYRAIAPFDASVAMLRDYIDRLAESR